MYSSSNNFGLLFGNGFKWLIGKHWDLIANLSGAFLASRFDVKRDETDLFQNLAGALETQSIQLKSEYWSFRPPKGRLPSASVFPTTSVVARALSAIISKRPMNHK
jgi:hypothetical protein